MDEAQKPKQIRKRRDGEPRLPASIRITKSYREEIEQKHGSIQKWFDAKLYEEFGLIQEIEVVKAAEQISDQSFKNAAENLETISENDF